MNKIIFDLEATCVSDRNDFQSEIIEIGAVKLDNNNQVIDEFNVFVKPIVHPELTEFCKELTTIRQADVDAADDFRVCFTDFVRWIGRDPYVLCSWGFYDIEQMGKDCKLHGIPNLLSHAKHISLKHQHCLITGMKPMGMAKALKLAGIKLDGTHHRGIDDARNIAKIYLAYLDKWDFN